MVKLTQMQEKFCFNVAVKNMTYSDAYRNSYNAQNYTNESVNVQASKMMSNPNILLRVDELKAEAKEMMMKAELYDRKKHMEELELVRTLALAESEENKKELNTALKATELKGKVSELYNFTEKKEISGGLFNANVEVTKEDKQNFNDIILRGINGKQDSNNNN